MRKIIHSTLKFGLDVHDGKKYHSNVKYVTLTSRVWYKLILLKMDESFDTCVRFESNDTPFVWAIDSVTTLDLVTVFRMTKCVTK